MNSQLDVNKLTLEDELTEAHAQLAAINRAMAVAEFDLAGHLLSANDNFLHVFGYHRDEVLGKHHRLFVPPDYANSAEYGLFWQRLAAGEFLSDTFERVDKQGKSVWLEANYNPVFNAKGNIYKIVKFAIDISQSELVKQEASQLQKQERLFRDLLDSAPDAMIIADASGSIRMVNKQAESLFGYTREELVGQLLEILIPERYRHHHPEKRNGFFQKPAVREMGSGLELFGRAKDGHEIPIELSLSPIETDEGMWAASAIRDITERRLANQQLQIAMKAAEEATKTKSDFLANMSHEIRTPMNAIIGMSFLALQSELNPQQRNYISKVHRSAESLLGIINDILDFSKIEAGMLHIEKVPFNLGDVLQRLADVIAFKAEENGIELLFSNTHSIPKDLMGDPLRLGQILLNLGSNAVKFTHDGEIVVDIEVVEETESRIALKFSIKDSGIGMTPEQQAKLFQSFSQADASTTRKYGGTGLGLSISKRLVELMDGEIWVDSEEGKGSNFQFIAHFDKPVGATITYELTEQCFSDKHALIVDNNRHARQILMELLEHMGMTVTAVASGEKALEICKKTSFDLVLMDWMMPGLDGLATTEQLAQTLDCLPSVVMVTAYGQDAVFEAALASGLIKAVVTKPITLTSLTACLKPLFGTQVKDQQPHHKTQQQHYIKQIAGAHLLLVEDNAFNQELAVAILATASISVTIANNGQEALDILAQAGTHFDGILMDCQMPVMDGYTATRLIRAQAAFTDMPILAMTANAMSDDRDKVLAVGMNEHIAKPINIEQLFLTLSRWIKPKRNRAMTSAMLDASTQSTQQANEHQSVFLDRHIGLRYTHQNEALYQKLLCRFYEQRAEFYATFEQLTQATLSETEQETIARNLHSLKGMAATLGAVPLSESVALLEQYVKSGSSENNLAHCVGALDALMDYLTAECRVKDSERAEPNSTHQDDGASFRQALQSLSNLLDSYDGQASECFEQMTLTYAHDADMMAKLNALAPLIQGYDFDGAVALIATY